MSDYKHRLDDLLISGKTYVIKEYAEGFEKLCVDNCIFFERTEFPNSDDYMYSLSNTNENTYESISENELNIIMSEVGEILSKNHFR